MAMLQLPGRKSGAEKSAQANASAVPSSWSVNLLPSETVQRHAERQLIRRFAVGGVGVVALVGAAWMAQTVAIKSAEHDLAVAGVTQQAAREALTALAPIQTFSSAMNQQEQVIGTTMGNQTSWDDALRGFRSAWPTGSRLQTLDATLGEGCPGPQPFEPPASIGCINWSVSVPGQEQVRDLVSDLDGVRGLVSPYLTAATRNESRFDSTGTVNITDELLTHRFTTPASEVTP